jgi:predicted component of type VI protein secretion system
MTGAPSGGVAAALRVVAAGGDPGHKVGDTLPLAPANVIGAGEDSTLLLGDPYVSGRHARLSRDAAGWWVEDLGSANGTWVDGRPCRVGERARLVRGGRLALGDMVLELDE